MAMEKTMQAAIFLGEGSYELREVPVPGIEKDDQVLMRVTAAGICGTDMKILEVPPGHPATTGKILGHEYTGEIIETGPSVKGFSPGDHVVIDPNITCGTCPACRDGMNNMCGNMTTLGIFIDGGFAPYNVAPECALYKIAPEVTPERAVMSEALSCVVSAVRKIQLKAGETATVMGIGPIGLLFALLLKASGAGKVILVEPSEKRRDFAEIIGFKLTFPPEDDLADNILAETDGTGSDVVVDAVGCMFAPAVEVVRRGGRILLFGQNENACAQITQNTITRKELTVMGSYIANNAFPATIKMLENGVIEPEKLISHTFSLADIQKGFDAMKDGTAIKVVIKP